MTMMLLAAPPEELSPVCPIWKRLMGRRTRRGERPSRIGVHARVVSSISYWELVLDFVDEIIPELARMGKPEKTRVVVFFDC